MNKTRKHILNRRTFMAGSAALAVLPRISLASENETGFDYVLELKPASASLLADPAVKTPAWDI